MKQCFVCRLKDERNGADGDNLVVEDQRPCCVTSRHSDDAGCSLRRHHAAYLCAAGTGELVAGCLAPSHSSTSSDGITQTAQDAPGIHVGEEWAFLKVGVGWMGHATAPI